MADVSVLEREMYREAEAARYLGIPQNTLNYWLEDGTRRGRTYPPVIRAEPRGRRVPVTWAEFVEAGLLRGYRSRGIPMAELRTFIDLLRERFQIPYPLADRRPYVAGRRLVLEAQEQAGLDPDFWLVADVHGQLMLLPPSDEFVQRVTWDGDLAARWRPHDDGASPVAIDPDLRGGRPAVGGISTSVLWEHDSAGEDHDDLAADFGLTVDQVRWALAYENSLRAS
ncbi:MAG TPA: DUF433 domain-containing protein [Mycobacteriales bacterium]|nr:DUF433 domain-containing protein [Mycobacteriales bacterium]